MRNKILLFSLLASVTAVAFVALLGATFFVLADTAPVQAEEATLELAPAQQVEPVSNVIEKPAQNYERVDYAKKSGGCSYESAEQFMAQTSVDDVGADEPLLTLAEAQ
jgi:hypothetical protein